MVDEQAQRSPLGVGGRAGLRGPLGGRDRVRAEQQAAYRDAMTEAVRRIVEPRQAPKEVRLATRPDLGRRRCEDLALERARRVALSVTAWPLAAGQPGC